MKKADAVAHFGTSAAVAKALKIFPAAVYQWGEDVPPLRAYQLEKLTRGKLRADTDKPPKQQEAQQ